MLAMPGHTPQLHNNQQVTALGRAELPRGLLSDTFSRGVNWRFSEFRGGRIEVSFCYWKDNLVGSSWSHTSHTPQSTSDCIGVG